MRVNCSPAPAKKFASSGESVGIDVQGALPAETQMQPGSHQATKRYITEPFPSNTKAKPAPIQNRATLQAARPIYCKTATS
jgi:hypothetical protein